MGRQGNPVTVPAGDYSISFFPGSHTIRLHGRADSPASIKGKPVEITLSPGDIRQALIWIAMHPDEYGPALRAIVTEWEQDAELNVTDLDAEVHTSWLSTSRRDRLAAAATKEADHAGHADH